MSNQKNNPLHGKTLEMILEHLVGSYGWEVLGEKINIRCFNENPSIKSSLTFLRKTAWARTKVESLYIYTLRKERQAAQKKEDDLHL
ncbi:MAG: DUF2132 domain-containing protein [Cytophagales bacterium]|nr:MAG: DUF2132 domain-containing protein [Cytophagales bacterium]